MDRTIRREYQRKYKATAKGRATAGRAQLKYRSSLRGKAATSAQAAVQRAVRRGVLPKPDSILCDCGTTAVEYHHHKGYAPEHWLDVIAVCQGCHTGEHNG